MSMADLESAFELLERLEDVNFVGPTQESLIVQAEHKLGLRFPPTYRRFLAALGSASFAGKEFYGVVRGGLDVAAVPNGIWLTLDERSKGGLPQSMIIISDTGDGGYYAIDLTETAGDGESPVLEWWSHVPRQECPKVASDFGEFFLQSAKQSLEP